MPGGVKLRGRVKDHPRPIRQGSSEATQSCAQMGVRTFFTVIKGRASGTPRSGPWAGSEAGDAKSSGRMRDWRRECHKPRRESGLLFDSGAAISRALRAGALRRGTAAARLPRTRRQVASAVTLPSMTAPADLTGTVLRAGHALAARDHSSADRPSRPAAVRARIGGGFAARSYRVRRASCGAAPPASRLLRTARPRGGLRPVLTPEPLYGPSGQNVRAGQGLPGRRATHTAAGAAAAAAAGRSSSSRRRGTG